MDSTVDALMIFAAMNGFHWIPITSNSRWQTAVAGIRHRPPVTSPRATRFVAGTKSARLALESSHYAVNSAFVTMDRR